jgi:transglutaminase-like putative cysteine protease
MKKINSFLRNVIGIGLLFPLSVSAQTDFSVAKINPALLKDADAVVRLDEMVWDIKSVGEAVQKNRVVVTILNESGEEEHGILYVRYDKFTRITDISGTLYDAEGKQVKKLRNSEIEDYGYGSSGDDISDARMKLASFGKKSYAYPYTIEYVYETRKRNMMLYPWWTPVSDEASAVELSTYKIKAPAGFKFRFKEYNAAPVAVKSKDADGSDLYQWTLKDYAAKKATDFYPLPVEDRVPLVIVAPSEFEVQDYKGNFNTWEDFGKFYHTLNAGRDVLPANTLAEIKEVVKSAKSDREKAEMIYKWMQSRSRYVSIQLGIGGWQTIDAATVAKTGYGDCKALTNFTMAALRSVGIPCYPALIGAGAEERMKPDFPSNQFNHAIACALVGKDTLWLECTSQTTKPNFMGSFTGSRYALLVTPEGGKLVPTPDYKAGQNVRNSRALVKLAESGDGEVNVQVLYTGLQHETRASVINGSTKDEQKKWLLNHINLPSMDLQGFELAQGNDREPVVTEKLTLNVRNCATKTGTRLFVKPSLLSRPFELPAATERTTDFYLPVSAYNFTDLDTVSYQLPANYKLETTLPAFQISSAFGSYEMKTTLVNNKLICARKVVMNGGRYESKDFTAWVDFLKKIRKADRAQVVFVENKL